MKATKRDLLICSFCDIRKTTNSYDTDSISVGFCENETCEIAAWDRYEEIIDNENMEQ